MKKTKLQKQLDLEQGIRDAKHMVDIIKIPMMLSVKGKFRSEQFIKLCKQDQKKAEAALKKLTALPKPHP